MAKNEARFAAIRIKDYGDDQWDGVGIIGRRGHLLLADTAGRAPSDKIPHSTDWANAAPVDFCSFNEGRPGDLTHNVAFSDGSKDFDGPCGFGVVVCCEGKEEVHSEMGSVGCRAIALQAEVFAIHRAALTICLLYTSDAADE